MKLSEALAVFPVEYRQFFTFPDPLLEGLHRRLPAKGETFTKDQQDNWIELAERIFDVIWGDGETP